MALYFLDSYLRDLPPARGGWSVALPGVHCAMGGVLIRPRWATDYPFAGANLPPELRQRR